MALAYTFSSTATRTGAQHLNRLSRTAAQEDLGGKLQALISQVNALITGVSAINAALSAGVAASQASGFSFTAISATLLISNFRA